MAEKKHSVHFDITATDRASQALAAVEKNLTGVVLAAVSIGGIGASFTAFMADALKTRSALDDLSDTTGDNVRTLDGLRRQAAVTGIEFEQMSNGLTKFARNLNAADDEGKAAAQAIEAMGLKVGELRAMKPADAMIEIAKALNGFEDGASKVAVAVALMGKEGAKMLPFLKDIAEAGELNGRITAEQAAQAERTEKEWRKLTQNFKDGKDALANELIPALGDYAEQMRKGIELTGGFGKALILLGTINPFRSVQGNISELTKDLETLQSSRTMMAGMQGMGAERVGISTGNVDQKIVDLKHQIEFLKFQQRQQALHMTGPEYQDARDLLAAKKPKLDFVPAGPNKALKDQKDDAERIAKQIADGDVEFNKTVSEAWSFVDKATIKRDTEFAADRAKMMKQVREFDAEQVERAMQREQTALLGVTDKADKAAEAARALGMTFSSSFEDAVVGGKDLRSVMQGLSQDVARIFFRKGVTEPLAAGFSDFFKPVTSWIGELFSGLFKAEGGPVMAGESYIVGEKGPELFSPGVSGTIIPNSKLGGSAGAGMGGSYTPVSIDNTFSSRNVSVDNPVSNRMSSMSVDNPVSNRMSSMSVDNAFSGRNVRGGPVNVTNQNMSISQTIHVGGNVSRADLPAILYAAKNGALAAVAEMRRRNPLGVV